MGVECHPIQTNLSIIGANESAHVYFRVNDSIEWEGPRLAGLGEVCDYDDRFRPVSECAPV